MANHNQENKFIDIDKFNLPKGGGAYSGQGENIAVDGFTGDARFSLPIYTTPCRGFEPQLSIAYNASGGQDVFGMGFSVQIPFVSRKTDHRIPTYDDDKDIFYISGSGELTPNENAGDTAGNIHKKMYMFRDEGSFSKIEYMTSETESYWKVTDKNNVINIFGAEDAKRADPNDPGRVFSWFLTESTDAKGNRTEYEYNAEGMISCIRYGFINNEPCFILRFSYGETRKDPIIRYNCGFLVEIRRLCENIEMLHCFDGKSRVVRKTEFTYDKARGPSLLTKISTTAYLNESDESVESMTFPDICFEYTEFEPHNVSVGFLETENKMPFTFDTDGFSLIDLNGDGIPGLLYAHDKGALYCPPLGEGKYNASFSLPQFPIDRDVSGGKAALTSLEGNGRYELVVHSDNRHGFYEQKNGKWMPYKPFGNYTNEYTGPHIESTDMQGDRLSHICTSDSGTMRYYPSMGKKGVNSSVTVNIPEDFPEATKNSLTEIVTFSDVFGDGLSHRVRIKNGSVDCWPNLGYGSFGAKVSFENAPDFGNDFDTSRLFFADIDGSGPVDLVYIHFDHAEIFLNNGHGFSAPIEISLPEHFTRTDSVLFADVLGTGVNCLILSKFDRSAKHIYMDFTNGKKPYMLSKINNNMGRVTEFSFTSSVQLMLKDEKKKPWTLKVPFPIQLVTETRDYDIVSKHLITTAYDYKEGSYDFNERKFRGFAVVEQTVTETIESYNYEKIVRTRTFYHIGEKFDRLNDYFWNKDNKALNMETPQIEAENPEKAEKSLTGHVLCEEIYGQDENPYAVTRHSYAVRELMPPQKDRYGSYLVSSRQNINYVYECRHEDPVITHNFVTDTDAFGNPLQSCIVNYPRRNGEYALSCVLSLTRYADITENALYSDVPVETRTLEVSGLNREGYFSFTEIKEQLNKAVIIPYGVEFSPSQTPQARLLQWKRFYYRNDNSDKALPLGDAGSRLLLHHSEEAAFPCEFPAGKIFEDELITEAGYITADGYWWKTAGIYYYHEADSFFLPKSEENQYMKTTVCYDNYYLIPIEIQKYSDNSKTIKVSALIDYNVMQYSQIKDANDNISQAIYNPLGQVVATSFFGVTEGVREGFGDLKNYKKQSGSTDDILKHPEKYLQNAASFFYCNLHSYCEDKTPVHSVSLIRSGFPDAEETAVQTVISYGDGFGRPVEEKHKYGNLWAVKGKKITDGEDKELLVYQPYFSENSCYEDIGFHMPPIINNYDALGRLVRTKSPQGLFSPEEYAYLEDKTEYGLWEQKYFGFNQVLKSSGYYSAFMKNFPETPTKHEADKKAAIEKALAFDGMCKNMIFDNLGRKVKEFTTTEDTTYYEYDVLGRLTSMADSRQYAGNRKNISYVYDMTGEILCADSCDAGLSYELKNIFGKTVLTIDPEGNRLKTIYDALMRPVSVMLISAECSIKIETTEYGETLPADEAKGKNLIGQVYKHCDQAGAETFETYNILGTVICKNRRLSEEYDMSCKYLDWNFPVNISKESYSERFTYNALSAITEHIQPNGQTVVFTYDDMGRLKGAAADGRIILEDINYTAGGQHTCVKYGNGVMLNYTYDLYSLNLVRAVSLKNGSEIFCDYYYAIDPVGSVSRIRDGLGQVVYNDNQAAAPVWDYTFDAENRLTKATGRMCGGDERDLQNLQPYTQNYTYDAGSNMTCMQHTGPGAYKLEMKYDDKSNHLLKTKKEGFVEEHLKYDDRGNTVSMPNLRRITYNAMGQLTSAVIIERENGENDAEYYNYDSSGSRIRKLTRRMAAPGLWETTVRVYLGGYSEKTVEVSGEVTLQRTSARITMDDSAAAIIYNWKKDIKNRETDTPGSQKTVFQLSSHINSVCTELNEKAEIITREEYFPFGGTALVWGNEREVKLKEYRFAGKEKDATGLYYFESRYYHPGYGRMISADGIAYIKPENPESLNLYAFCQNNPITFTDPSGHDIYIFNHMKVGEGVAMARVLKNRFPEENVYIHTLSDETKTSQAWAAIGDKNHEFFSHWELCGNFNSSEGSGKVRVVISNHATRMLMTNFEFSKMTENSKVQQCLLMACNTGNRIMYGIKLENNLLVADEFCRLGAKKVFAPDSEVACEVIDCFSRTLRVSGKNAKDQPAPLNILEFTKGSTLGSEILMRRFKSGTPFIDVAEACFELPNTNMTGGGNRMNAQLMTVPYEGQRESLLNKLKSCLPSCGCY